MKGKWMKPRGKPMVFVKDEDSDNKIVKKKEVKKKKEDVKEDDE